jgi:pentatricopeptide repeat protein
MTQLDARGISRQVRREELVVGSDDRFHRERILRIGNILLAALGDLGHLEHAEIVFEMMASSQIIRPTVVTYSTLVSRAGAWQNVDMAEKYFQEMINVGLMPDTKAYNSLLNAYAKSNDVDKAVKVFLEMIGKNLEATAVTYNTLLDACARLGNVEKAKVLFAMMEKNGVTPNVRSYSSMIHCLCRAGYIGSAFDILDEMKHKRLKPSEVTYSLLLHSLGDTGDLEKAQVVMEQMMSDGISPNVVSLSSLIHNCGKHGQLNRAVMIYREMLASINPANRPNSITCSSLIDSCLKQDRTDLAFEILDDMRKDRIPLNEVTYTSLIAELTRLGQLDRIVEVVVTQEGSPPVMRSWQQEINALSARANSQKFDVIRKLQLYRNLGNYDGVIALFEELKAESKFPSSANLNSDVYLILLESVLEKSRKDVNGADRKLKTSVQQKRQNDLFRLYLIFQEMKIAGIQADTAIYNTLINACASAGDVDRAVYTVQLMQEDGISPDVITYTSLIKGCAILGGDSAASIAEGFFQAMQQRTNHFSSYIEPTELTYSRLMQANLAATPTRTGRVWELFKLMRMRNILPGIYSFR